MQPIPSTTQILACKVLGRTIDETWVNWAYNMLLAGFETENLVMLAGELAPYNQFELQRLTDKIFTELNLSWDNREQTLKNYVCYLVDTALAGEIKFARALNFIKEIHIELDHDTHFGDFYMLYYAHEDLEHSENQWYWDGATRENIDELTKAYFIQWRSGCSEPL